MSRSKSELVALLRRVGVADPESWADSEVREDIPQLARAILLRRLWPEEIDGFATDLSWIDAAIAEHEKDGDAPFADAGAALSAVLAAGVAKEDLGKIARSVAFSAVAGTLYRIDERADYDFEDGPGWALIELDHLTQRPTGRFVGGLHESILEVRPT
ncbi:MAG: hypothetical protein ABI725_02505 [Chloroflexota bacterium]